MKPMPHAVMNAASFVLGGCFFMAGGSAQPVGKARWLQMLDVATGEWTERALVSAGRFEVGAVYEGRFFYVSRNVGAAPTIAVYNPDTDAWSFQPPLELPLPCLLTAEDNEEVQPVTHPDGIVLLGRTRRARRSFSKLRTV
jgi:hypothetical protein